MKKKNIIILLSILGLLGVQSCKKDFIELSPKVNQLEANYYLTENQAFLGLTAVYDAVAAQNWQFVPLVSDIKSDDAFCGGGDANDMAQWQTQEKFIPDGENSSVKDFWSRCYSGIYRANQILEKLDNVTWTTPGLKNRYIAEAKFLRGYFYWDLVRHFGWVPILLKVEPDPEALKSLPQSTPSQVYKQVVADMLAAMPDLPKNVTGAEVGRVSQNVAKSLLARIYLFYTGIKAIPELGITGELTDGTTQITKTWVKSALNDVIISGNFALLPNYADVFNWANENNKEMIFCFQYSEISKASDWGSGWGNNGNFSVIFQGPRNVPPAANSEFVDGWSFGTLSFSLVNEFEIGDPRKATVVFDAEANLTNIIGADGKSASYARAYQNTGYFNKKFIPRKEYKFPNDAHNYPINYPDIRYADVLLMAAEVNMADDAPKALGYLNQVRTRAMGAGAAKTSIDLDAIYHERRVELAGEGHRYWDLLRRGLDYTKTKIDASFQNIPNNGKIIVADFVARPFDKATLGMVWIPLLEVRNTGGNLKQNIPAFKSM